jgi:hypothetical protein
MKRGAVKSPFFFGTADSLWRVSANLIFPWDAMHGASFGFLELRKDKQNCGCRARNKEIEPER